jgi:hypothetical protein
MSSNAFPCITRAVSRQVVLLWGECVCVVVTKEIIAIAHCLMFLRRSIAVGHERGVQGYVHADFEASVSVGVVLSLQPPNGHCVP